MNKLPVITLSFWIMKICATTLGETAGDLLSMTMHVGYAVSSVILLTLFLIVNFQAIFPNLHHEVQICLQDSGAYHLTVLAEWEEAEEQ